MDPQCFRRQEIGENCISGRTEEHFCPPQDCNWAASFELLLELNALSLTCLSISSHMCSEMASERSPLPCLTSLVLEGVEFTGDVQQFEDVVQPFLASASQTLEPDDCSAVPEAFCDWLDPKAGNWPGLETLSLENLENNGWSWG